MIEEPEIPSPDDSGSTGEQQPPDPSTEVLPAEPQTGLPPVVDAIQKGLGAGQTDSLDDFGKKMVAAATRQISDENQELKAENRRLRERIDAQRDQLESERIDNAVLRERIKSHRRNRHLRNFGIVVGTGLVNTGIILSRTTTDNYFWGLVISGGLLLLLSWFGIPGRKKK